MTDSPINGAAEAPPLAVAECTGDFSGGTDSLSLPIGTPPRQSPLEALLLEGRCRLRGGDASCAQSWPAVLARDL